MRDVICWGGTGQAKVLYEALSSTEYQIVAIVDNRNISSPFTDVPLLNGLPGLDSWLNERSDMKDLYSVVAVGGSHSRDRLELMKLFQKRGLIPLTVIHRKAFVAEDVQIGEGCQILAQATVCTCAHLGSGVIVNTATSIDHDCIIGDGVHLAPGVHLAGEVTVGDRVFIGTGATVLPHIHIGEDAVVGAGAVVTKDVPPKVTVLGNPARLHQSDR